METKNLPQLLKWVGNKHRFADEIISYMPKKINTYIEPFLGSGAVLGKLSNIREVSKDAPHTYQKAIGGDALKYVIDIFNYVKDNPKIVNEHYKKCIDNYMEDKEANYLEIRDRFNREKNALDFMVLTRTCYSGIVRFRKADGYMSTPVGPHKPISPDSFAERVNSWNKVIQDVNFIHADFKETMAMAKEGDLIYCDPPYTHSQSILYGSQDFNIAELWEAIYNAKSKGVKVMLSINGLKKSGTQDISTIPPNGIFEYGAFINCGMSMINRLQNLGDNMADEVVHDRLLLTWQCNE